MCERNKLPKARNLYTYAFDMTQRDLKGLGHAEKIEGRLFVFPTPPYNFYTSCQLLKEFPSHY